ncbi:MAG: CBS domain-containing protein, partial [Tepidisphaeraceae bacterium]
VHSIPPSATVLEATNKMNAFKIGALLVMQDGRVAGMFTERDVMRRVIGEMRNPGQTRVSDVMSTDVICVGPEADLDEAGAIMKERRVRHLPVCDRDGNLYGMISIGDINAYNVSQQASTIEFLNEYIYGRA